MPALRQGAGGQGRPTIPTLSPAIARRAGDRTLDARSPDVRHPAIHAAARGCSGRSMAARAQIAPFQRLLSGLFRPSPFHRPATGSTEAW